MKLDLPITVSTINSENSIELFKDKFLIPDWLEGYNNDTTDPVHLSHIVMAVNTSKPFVIDTEYSYGLIDYMITRDDITEPRDFDEIIFDSVHSHTIRSASESFPMYVSVNNPYGIFGQNANQLPASMFWNSRMNVNKETEYYSRCEHGIKLTSYYLAGGTTQILNVPLYIDIVKTPVSLSTVSFFFDESGETHGSELIDLTSGDTFGFWVIGKAPNAYPSCQIFSNYIYNIFNLCTSDSPILNVAKPVLYDNTAHEVGESSLIDLSTIRNVIEAFFGIVSGDVVKTETRAEETVVPSLDIPGTSKVITLWTSQFRELEDTDDMAGFCIFKVTYSINNLSEFSEFANNKSLWLRAYDPTMGYEPVPPTEHTTKMDTQLFEDHLVFNKVTTGDSIGDLSEVYDVNSSIIFTATGKTIRTETNTTLATLEEKQDSESELNFVFDYIPSENTPSSFSRLSFGIMTSLEGAPLESNTVASLSEGYVYLRQNKVASKLTINPLNNISSTPVFLKEGDYSVDASGGVLRIGIVVKIKGYWNGKTKLKFFVKDVSKDKYIGSFIDRPIIIDSSQSEISEI